MDNLAEASKQQMAQEREVRGFSFMTLYQLWNPSQILEENQEWNGNAR
jgi:hypothetical protein